MIGIGGFYPPRIQCKVQLRSEIYNIKMNHVLEKHFMQHWCIKLAS